MPDRSPSCHVCGSARIDQIRDLLGCGRVTSDCKPWPGGALLQLCGTCGVLQKGIDDAWQAEIARIYDDYAVYHQAGGAEQRVFQVGSGSSSARSPALVEHLRSLGVGPPGRLLDIGCGNGSFLAAAAAGMPGWSMVGTELDERSRDVVEAIDGVEAMMAVPLPEVPGTFDLVVMVHVLEHVIGPRQMLSEVRDKLRPGGTVLVDVPNHLANPFDLVIADHATHFEPTTMRALLEGCGFEVVAVTDAAIPREVVAVARRPGGPPGAAPPGSVGIADRRRAVQRRTAWLAALADHASSLAGPGALGLFGSAIAATWLSREMGSRVSFFVDEDPARQGRRHLGLPILGPDQVPGGATVVVALVPEASVQVAARLDRPGVAYVALPPW